MKKAYRLEIILIITSSIDQTVDYLMKKYCDKAEFCRIDVDKFSDYEIDIGGIKQWCIKGDNWEIEKKDVYSIYYRKPRIPNLNGFQSAYRGMIAKDIITVINGIVDDFEGKVLTKPCILRKTENKIYQLLYAEKNGLKIPNSYIGNCRYIADAFIDIKAIIKPITTGKLTVENKTEIYQTNYFTGCNEDIKLTPLYLQKYENKKYEVRLTYINGTFFAVRIDSEDKLDWRRNYKGLRYSVLNCPDQIKEICIKLLTDFELKYGAFDFIINEKDEWVFLEVNPNGQWQWLEQVLNLPISEKIIDYLLS